MRDELGAPKTVDGSDPRGTAMNGCASRKSSIFLRRMIGSMFVGVNSKCAHQLRPPLGRMREGCRETRREARGIDSLNGPSLTQQRHRSPLTRAAK